MAGNSSQTDFRIPQEPLPVPPARDEMPVSDEESFVVLEALEVHFANTNGNTTQTDFRIPQEPLPVPPVANSGIPVPCIAANEQSFDVLEKSFEENHSFGKSILQEGKLLIQEELDRIEGNSSHRDPPQEKGNSHSENHIATANQNGHEAPLSQSFHSTNSSAMEQSTVLPAMPQPQLDSNDLSRTISILSFAQGDFPSEELHLKVTQLIEENIYLKDTMLQNNMSMKAQYEKIVAWQKDVEKVHETHKQKFREAKQCIEMLKKENTRLEQENKLLEQEIQNLRYSLKLQEVDNNKTKQVITQSSETNLKQFELDVANKKIKDLEAALEKMTIKGNEDTENVPSKWKAMEEKLEKYEKALEEGYKRNNELKKTSSDNLQVYIEKLEFTEEKLRQTEVANEQMNIELASLRNQLARNLQGSDASSKLQYELDQSKNKIAEMQEQLVSRNATLMDAKVRSEKLESNLLEANEKIMAMDVTVTTLQAQLEEAKIEAWKNKQKVTEKENQLGAVQIELESMQQQRHLIVTSQNANEILQLRQQLMQSQMAMTQCDQNRAVAYAQIETQKNEIAELRRQLATKSGESDDMFALRTQLDLYKADFEAERVAKEDIKRDKEKLSEDLQHLHRRNQQLQEEIEILRGQLGDVPTSRSQNSENQGAAGWSTNSPLPTGYACPICNVEFRTLKLVQDHLDTCICHAPW